MATTISSNIFRYRALARSQDGTDQIRLLEILRPLSGPMRTGAQEPHIQCRLIHVPLDERTPRFWALSYCWGNPADATAIYCRDGSQPNGTEAIAYAIKVTRNLSDALNAVQARLLRTSPNHRIYIWADAVCINQEDTAEKNYQVPLMRRIYQQADEVLVWLGHSGEDSDLSLIFLLTVREVLSSGPQIPSGRMMQSGDWARIGFDMPFNQLKLHIRAFYELLTRPWFRRIWVIQEYAVAKDVKILIGGEELDHTYFISAIMLMNVTMGQTLAHATRGIDWLSALYTSKSEQETGTPLPLVNELQRHRRRIATDPRDKIFALLGLASDVGTGPGCLDIRVDYCSSTKDLYRDTAMKILIRDQNLDIVALAGKHVTHNVQGTNGQRTAGLPSWVPDWQDLDATSSLQGFELGYVRRIWDDQADVLAAQSIDSPYDLVRKGLSSFHAAGDTAYLPSFVDGGDGLCVRGMLLDSIRAIGAWNVEPEDAPASLHSEPSSDYLVEEKLPRLCNRIQSWIDITNADSESREYFNGETMLDVFWQTQLAGHYFMGFDRERQTFMKWYTHFRDFLDINRTFRERPEERASAFQTHLLLSIMTGGRDVPLSFEGRAGNITGNRAIFVTHAANFGHEFVGLAVNGSREGDSVVILEGGGVPFIVRPSGNGPTWELVGACYVHGCMRGEIFDPSRCIDMVIV